MLLKARHKRIIAASALVTVLALAVTLTMRNKKQIDFQAIFKESSGPVNVVVIGDSYSQAPTRWSRSFITALTQNYGRAPDGWVGYGFYRNSDVTYDAQTQPIGMDASAFGDNSVTYLGTWNSNYGKTPCSDLSGAQTESPGALLLRHLPEFDFSGELTVEYVPRPGAQLSFSVSGRPWTAVDLGQSESPIERFTIPLSRGDRELTLRADRGFVQLCGDKIDGALSGVRMHKIAASGSSVRQWVNVDRDVQLANFSELSPNLYIVLLGTNSNLAEVEPDQWAQNMTELLSRMTLAAPEAEVLIVMPPQNMRTDLRYKISDYSEKAKKIATDQEFAYLDLQGYFGQKPEDYSATSANPLFAEDGIHPTPDRGGPIMVDAILTAVGELD